jgi:glutamyl-tRNA reductase
LIELTNFVNESLLSKMSLLACGINHKTAPLALREKLVFDPANLANPLLELATYTGIKEATILSTCNRTELYCSSDQPQAVMDWLLQHKKLPKDNFQNHFYIHENQSAVQHIMRVATGLDSMILGEPQILGQLKKACATADEVGTFGKQLRHLFCK